VLLVLENHGFSAVAGHSPYLNRLAAACGLATDYRAVAHPSLPNYLALTSGSTHGITSDCTGCSVSATSIFGQLHGDWRSYLEAMPSAGFQGPFSGLYAKKHNPAAYYPAIAPAFARLDVPLAGLRADLVRGALKRFSLVVPDLCNDEHNCPPSTGDAWLGQWLPRLFASPAYRSGKTVLFVTYDEGVGRGNLVYTVVASPSVRAHTVVAAPFDHYSLLRTTEDLLGLPCLAKACTASPMERSFHLTAGL
jgi:phospholipase C